MENKPTMEEAFKQMQAKAHETATQQTGCCVYNRGGKTYKAVVDKSVCDSLGGIFFPGKPC